MKLKNIKECLKLCFILVFFVISVFTYASNKNMKTQQEKKENFDETKRVIGEYIITVTEKTDIEYLYTIFASYKVIIIKSIRENIFLIKLEKDPGIEIMRSEFIGKNDIIDIQPNYEYSIKPPKKKEFKIEPE